MTVEDINKQFEKAAEPVRKFQAALIEHAEKATQFHLEAARRYSDLALSQVREASTLNSAEGVQGYMQKAPQVARETSETVVADAQKLAQMNQAFGEALRKIAEDNVTSVAQAAKGGSKKAA